MKVKQISIFLENKYGRLARVTKLLGKAGINIRALSIADTSDFGILRLIVDDPDKARSVLEEDGFTVSGTEVIAVRVADRPGGLSEVLEILGTEEINIEYMYAFVGETTEDAIVVFKVEEIDKAINTLTKAGVKLLKGSDIYNI